MNNAFKCFLVFVTMFIIICCTDKNKLIGRWSNSDSTIDCILYENNTYSFVNKNPFSKNPKNGYYKFENDSLSMFTNKNDSKAFFVTKITFFDDNKMAFGEEPLYRKNLPAN